jgi:hypothetical protein
MRVGRTRLGWKAALLVAAMVWGVGSRASAVSVLYTIDIVAPGTYQYNLFVDNSDGGEDLSGLNVLKGNSVFGLDDGSTIGAPTGWDSFAPLPPLIDDLNYFSLDSADDVLAGSGLGGFSFVSNREPSTLTGDDFAVEGIGSDCHCQIDLDTAQVMPEPGTALLLGAGLAALAARSRRTRS